jgi:GNAT superfamily N-acetyltransferase
MTGTGTWRLATRADDDAIVAMVEALYVEDPSDEPVPIENTRRTLDVLRGEPVRGRVVVLAVGDGLAGYAFLISFWSNELGGEVIEIDELYVVASSRGQGCASSLIRSLRDGSGPWPRVPVALALQVTPSNDRARRLYERLGFAAWKNTTLIARL